MEVNAICIASNASLTIEKGAQLTVFSFSEGLIPARLQCFGTLIQLDELEDGNALPESPLAGKKQYSRRFFVRQLSSIAFDDKNHTRWREHSILLFFELCKKCPPYYLQHPFLSHR